MSPSPTARYPEKVLQKAAIQWLKDHRAYREEYADEEARGARMDSVGVLEGRLALIEVKVTVGANVVGHAPDRAHSLKAKIAGTLGPLYRGEHNSVASAAHRVWDRRRPPLVCILARSFSADGLSALSALLMRRAEAWLFDFAIWKWNGEEIESLTSCVGLIAPPGSYEGVEVPILVGRTPREKPRALAELQAIANERGVGELFRQFVQAAPDYGFRVERGRWCITLTRSVEGYNRPQTVLGAYLDGAAGIGLNVGCWRELIGVNEDELPGTRASKALGFLNTNRLLTAADEVNGFLRIFGAVRVDR
jgi:hypothetical protein